jgi:hypothetical protein
MTTDTTPAPLTARATAEKAWPALSPDDRDAIGIAALALAINWLAQEDCLDADSGEMMGLELEGDDLMQQFSQVAGRALGDPALSAIIAVMDRTAPTETPPANTGDAP